MIVHFDPTPRKQAGWRVPSPVGKAICGNKSRRKWTTEAPWSVTCKKCLKLMDKSQ